jgi:glycosyltransferase involved in cell wall biosynthesis
MRLPRVSILLPVHNEARLLPAALRSLQRQTLTDWELVVINDGSTDATQDILACAAAGDHRIRIRQQPKRGLVAALNAGLQNCRAPLVARMDADDVCHPQRLALQADFLDKHPEVTLVACQVRHVPRPRIRAGFLAYEDWQNGLLDNAAIRRDMYVESPFAHPSVVYRRDAILKLGGYRQMGWAEDYDLWLRLAQQGAAFARIPRILLYWRDRPERLSRTAPDYALAAFRRCKTHFLRRDFLADVAQVTLWGAGREGKAWRAVLNEAGITVATWIDIDPRKIGQTIHGAPVIDYRRLTPGHGKILVTIGAKGAREQVREFAHRRGLVEGQDFVCVT